MGQENSHDQENQADGKTSGVLTENSTNSISGSKSVNKSNKTKVAKNSNNPEKFQGIKVHSSDSGVKMMNQTAEGVREVNDGEIMSTIMPNMAEPSVSFNAKQSSHCSDLVGLDFSAEATVVKEPTSVVPEATQHRTQTAINTKAADTNATSDDDFNTPPTSPFKNQNLKQEDENPLKTEVTSTVVCEGNAEYEGSTKGTQLIQQEQANETVDDLTDIIGRLSLDTTAVNLPHQEEQEVQQEVTDTVLSSSDPEIPTPQEQDLYLLVKDIREKTVTQDNLEENILEAEKTKENIEGTSVSPVDQQDLDVRTDNTLQLNEEPDQIVSEAEAAIENCKQEANFEKVNSESLADESQEALLEDKPIIEEINTKEELDTNIVDPVPLGESALVSLESGSAEPAVVSAEKQLADSSQEEDFYLAVDDQIAFKEPFKENLSENVEEINSDKIEECFKLESLSLSEPVNEIPAEVVSLNEPSAKIEENTTVLKENNGAVETEKGYVADLDIDRKEIEVETVKVGKVESAAGFETDQPAEIELKADTEVENTLRPLATEVTAQEPTIKVNMAESSEDRESPIPLPKGNYNIDWDNLNNDINPFETKSKVVMGSSPPVGGGSNVDPFKSSNKMANSSPTKPKAVAKVDPFQSKKTLANSPPTQKKENFVVNNNLDSVDTNENLENEADPFKSKTSIPISPPLTKKQAPVLDDVDPFKSKNAIENSPPQTKKDIQPVLDNAIDPFKSNNAIPNSPTSTKTVVDYDNVDPFKSKVAIANSPTSRETVIDYDNVDPFKTKVAIANSPTSRETVIDYDNVDPFKTKVAIANSPTSRETVIDYDNIDPFKTKVAIANSPTSRETVIDYDNVDPFKTKVAIANSPTSRETVVDYDNVDPFKTKVAIANSPTSRETVIDYDNIDPFKTKVAIANSPTSRETVIDYDNVDPFKTKVAIANSPTSRETVVDYDNVDPFKTKVAIANSPTPIENNVPEQVPQSNEDPFKSNNTLTNNPPPIDTADIPEFDPNVEPFISSKSSNIPPPIDAADIPEFDPNVDPFISSKSLSNSPPVNRKCNPTAEYNIPEDEDIDPFKPCKTAMANSPPSSPKLPEEENPFKSKTALANSPLTTRKSPIKENSTAADSAVESDTSVNNTSIEQNNNTTKSEPAKKATPKKKSMLVGKKGAPRRFKPPPKIQNQGNDDEIQIFMPGQKPPPQSSQPAPPDEDTDVINISSGNKLEDSQCSNITSASSQDSGVDTQSTTGDDQPQIVGVPGSLSPQQETGKEREMDDMMTEMEMPEFGDEDFKPASEQIFNDPSAWDMLEKFGGTNLNLKETNLSRQSLYVKFDPLVKGETPPVQKVKTNLQQSQLIEESDDLLLMSTPPLKASRPDQHPAARVIASKIAAENNGPTTEPGSPELTGSNGNVDNFFACSPYSDSGGTNSPVGDHLHRFASDLTESREQPIIPELTQSWLENVKSLADFDGDSAILSTDSLDCMVGDALLNQRGMSGRPESPLQFDHEEILRIDTSMNNSAGSNNNGGNGMKKDSSSSRPFEPTDGDNIVQVLKYSQSDVNRMRKEWDLDSRGRFMAKEKEYMDKEKKLKEEKGDLEEQNEGLKISSEQMKGIVAEFEKTMHQLISEKESSSSASKESLTDLVRERDQALEDTASVEAAFSDLHRRYEKTKHTLDGFKKNEETLKKCVTDYQAKLKKQEERYQALKAHAEEKLEQANDEIEKVRKSTESENARLTAALKRAEMKLSGLERTVEQKERENSELTAICDELISKVGTT